MVIGAAPKNEREASVSGQEGILRLNLDLLGNCRAPMTSTSTRLVLANDPWPSPTSDRREAAVRPG